MSVLHAITFLYFFWLVPSDDQRRLKIIDVDELLLKIERDEAALDSVDSTVLKKALYLDAAIKRRIDRVKPSYFSHVRAKDFSTRGHDEFAVPLGVKYHSITDLVRRDDSQLYSFQTRKFGISMEDLSGDVLTFKNKAYMNFDSGTGYTSFVIALRGGDRAVITLIAYVIE